MNAMYASLSGGPGEPRDWDRLRSLFAPDARMIAARPGPEGGAVAWFLTVPEFIDANRKYLDKGGYTEKEVARRTESYGNIAHVWSTYEGRRGNSTEPTSRGIYSAQLLKDKDRWWIVNLFWDFERAESPIPDRYLTSPKE